ncbi:methionine ABC transporter ATP-binding protein [Sporolactobacillus spathodeae]|uniref:D-methionine transport system ATP-binding protein n=1 Tax=Sporolactobacillus spathodeae TaxID=1465502 RepID=A0ABS2QAT2_9BACL|nr:ATP-binding cassette domain-containing protein [Sporolactobacillus spathodeae]MBM7658911.1 D-methionine transport system ATP-binding protein [Sporolactobacillus spathodeae]
MIEFQDVSKIYHGKDSETVALKNVHLTIHDGEIYGVIGYSGAGKSTLIRMVNALETPSSGKVIVNGSDWSTCNKKQLRHFKKKIGMVFQHFNLLESKTVFANVAIPLILDGWSKDAIKKRVTELLDFVGLTDKVERYPNELSGGEKQRVGIARAIALNPEILLCDEATSALDPKTTEQILALLKRINQEYQITMLVITHEMGVIQKICQKVAVMEKGKIIEEGSVFDVFVHPKHPTTRDFVRTVIPDGLSDQLESFKNEKGQILKIEFADQTVSAPIINQLIKNFPVTVNILYANMSEIQGKRVGHMVIQLEGEQEAVNKAINYMKHLGIYLEEA